MGVLSEDIIIQSGNHKLVGTIDWNANKGKPTVLALHGSRPGDRQSPAYYTKFLAENGHSSLRFDYSGHGDSPGNTNVSLRELIHQATDALYLLDTEKPLTVIGGSLSGAIAVHMLEKRPITNLILLCPAAYQPKAYDVSYDERWDWRVQTQNDAPVFEILRQFTGNFLHIIGSEDELISKHVTNLYVDNSTQAKSREFIEIPEAPHYFCQFLAEHPKEKQDVLERMLILLKRTTKLA